MYMHMCVDRFVLHLFLHFLLITKVERCDFMGIGLSSGGWLSFLVDGDCEVF